MHSETARLQQTFVGGDGEGVKQPPHGARKPAVTKHATPTA